MIEWISNWAEAIIIAVIIATIIEMILPEGSNKKYIKVVIGVYILFTIISPIISNFTGKSLAVSDIINLDQYINEVKEKENAQNLLEQENEISIREIYIGNVKTDIKNKLKAKGYIISKIELDVGYDESYTLNKIIIAANKETEEELKENEESHKNINKEENQIYTEIQIINEININISNNNETKENYYKKEIKSNLTTNDKSKIKEYLSSVYEINEKDITIN